MMKHWYLKYLSLKWCKRSNESNCPQKCTRNEERGGEKRTPYENDRMRTATSAIDAIEMVHMKFKAFTTPHSSTIV